jgi:hypothetical protein
LHSALPSEPTEHIISPNRYCSNNRNGSGRWFRQLLNNQLFNRTHEQMNENMESTASHIKQATKVQCPMCAHMSATPNAHYKHRLGLQRTHFEDGTRDIKIRRFVLTDRATPCIISRFLLMVFCMSVN